MAYRFTLNNIQIECDSPDEIYALLDRAADAVVSISDVIVSETPATIALPSEIPKAHNLILWQWTRIPDKQKLSTSELVSQITKALCALPRTRIPSYLDTELTAFRHLNTQSRIAAVKRVVRLHPEVL